MLLRSKIWDLTKIIFWLLSVGRVVEGSVNDAQNSLEEAKTTSSHSEIFHLLLLIRYSVLAHLEKVG